MHHDFCTHTMAPNRAICLRLRFVVRIAKRKSPANSPANAKGGGQNVLFPQAGAHRTINTKMFAIQKKFLRGINFVKITKNILQSTRLAEERMRVTEKIGGRNEFP